MARRQVDRTAKYGVSNTPANTCRYCGTSRTGWGTTTAIDGHLQCTVTQKFIRLLRTTIKTHPGITYKTVAEAIGITEYLVRGLDVLVLEADKSARVAVTTIITRELRDKLDRLARQQGKSIGSWLASHLEKVLEDQTE